MDDLISRQKAIDALRDYLVEKRCPDDGTLTCRLIENEVINKLPSVQPERKGTRLSTVCLLCKKPAVTFNTEDDIPYTNYSYCEDCLRKGLKLLREQKKNLQTQPEHKTGRWIAITSRNNTYKCSVCGRLLVNITDGKNKVAKNYPYCHCGADMRGGENDGCSQVFEREESDV